MLLTLIFSFLMVIVFLAVAFSFYNRENQLGKFGFRIMSSAPTILTSMGILGTFVGISYSLLEFNTNDLDKSIPILLDGMKIAFIEYLAIQDIFYENDFNWNVPPSNHETREFKLVLERVKGILHKNTTIFEYEKDEKRLREFIKLNISQAKSSTKIKINKNNFIPIYLRWLEQVKPEIAINNRDDHGF